MSTPATTTTHTRKNSNFSVIATEFEQSEAYLLCIETLCMGYVSSYASFFTMVCKEKLVKSDDTERLRALQQLLKVSEISKRSSKAKDVYVSLTDLAKFSNLPTNMT